MGVVGKKAIQVLSVVPNPRIVLVTNTSSPLVGRDRGVVVGGRT